ncbi:hypothetical protein C1646_757613 [Rhizophagus diaphanus]|nr:hypothetical protein C1646_757613 [Rhizophagus diaphanus] [Rhizophagus sp. MUCL 43196]
MSDKEIDESYNEFIEEYELRFNSDEVRWKIWSDGLGVMGDRGKIKVTHSDVDEIEKFRCGLMLQGSTTTTMLRLYIATAEIGDDETGDWGASYEDDDRG